MIEIRSVQLGFDDVLIKDGDFKAERGKVTGLIGISGSGKSSFLDIVSLYRYAGQCDYELDGVSLKNSLEDERNQIKRTRIAYLTQETNYLSFLNCLDNVLMESEIAGKKSVKKRSVTFTVS